MFLRRNATRVGFLFMLLLATTLSFAPGTALAQDDTDPYDLMIGVGGEAAPEIPEQSVSVSVLSDDRSTEYGSCLLSIHTKPNGCSLEVPASTTIVAAVDASTLPDGIVPIENPITYTTPAEREGLGDFTFEFVWAAGATPVLDYDLQLMFSGDPAADIPDGTVSVTVYDDTVSTVYGSCFISVGTKPGGCSVMVPSSTEVAAVLDETSLPDGIGVAESAIWYTTPSEKTQVGDIWFELFYVDSGNGGNDDSVSDDPDGVGQLPNTGSGAMESREAPYASMPFLAGSLALLLAGISIRRGVLQRR